MSARLIVRWGLILVTVVALAIDAYVHFDLAAQYDPIASTVLSQGDLFRTEAIASIVAAVLLVVRPRWYTAGFATLVLALGTAALLVYRYWNVPAFGPIPQMYEPVWFDEKTLAFVAELVGTVTAAASVLAVRSPHRADSSARVPQPS